MCSATAGRFSATMHLPYRCFGPEAADSAESADRHHWALKADTTVSAAPLAALQPMQQTLTLVNLDPFPRPKSALLPGQDRLRGRTFSAPKRWAKGKGRVTVQFGCCYNYALDQQGRPPGTPRTSPPPGLGMRETLIPELLGPSVMVKEV